MTGRFCLLLLAPLLVAVALLPAPAARAQGPHIEFSPPLMAVGEIVLSFDLPADYTVTDQSQSTVWAEGPTRVYSWGEGGPTYLSTLSDALWSRGTAKEAAYEAVAELVGDTAGPILTEGPVTVGEFEGYTLQVRKYLYAGQVDTYSTELFVVVPVASEDDPLLYPAPEPGGTGYGRLWTGGDLELNNGQEVFLETGESVAQWHQTGFDAILGSLSVSAEAVATPTPEPVTPTPAAATRSRGGAAPTPEPTATPVAEPVTPTPTAAPVAPEGERVELGPLEFDGSQVGVSFALPSGYSVARQWPQPTEIHGPELQYGPSPEPVIFYVAFQVLDSSVPPQDAAREYGEAYSEDEFIEKGDFPGYVTVAEGNQYQSAAGVSHFLGEDAYFLEIASLSEEGGAESVGAWINLFYVVRLDEQHHAALTVIQSQGALDTSGEPYLVGGTPFPEVRQALFATTLASLRVSIEDLGAPQPEFVRSVPGPDQISTDPDVIGSNIFLALFVVLAFAFTSTLFNQTLEENRQEIEGWVGRFFTPLQRFASLVGQRYEAVAERQTWVQRAAGPAVILVLTGLIYGFLSPDFGFNGKSVVLFASLLVGLGAITYVYKGGQVLFTTRRLRLGAGVKLYAVALAIAAGSVLLSRLVDFQPGFLFGFVASYTLLAPTALDRKQSGQLVFFPAIALLALAIIAWLLVIPMREVTEAANAWWAALPEGAAVAVFVAGLEGLFFNMIPLTFMDGAKIAQWNRLLWFLMFGATGFLFWHVLLNQEGAYLHVLPERKVVAALSLLAFYSIVTVGTWAYFRRRVEG